MLTETQRAAMLDAMGIDVYRLRAAAQCAAPMRIWLDGSACVCVSDTDDVSARRLIELLPAILGVTHERVRNGDADVITVDAAVEIDISTQRGNGAAKRALWQSLKPLARRLHET